MNLRPIRSFSKFCQYKLNDYYEANLSKIIHMTNTQRIQSEQIRKILLPKTFQIIAQMLCGQNDAATKISIKPIEIFSLLLIHNTSNITHTMICYRAAFRMIAAKSIQYSSIQRQFLQRHGKIYIPHFRSGNQRMVMAE